MLEELIEFEAMENIASEVELDLVKIGSDVVKGYDRDLASREGWEGEMKEAMDIVLQVMETKNFPWPNASNIKMPLLTEAAIHFNSMMYSALVPQKGIANTSVVGADPNGEKGKQSIRVSKHLSYQVMEEMDWEEDMDIGLMILPILGNMYKKTYFDEINISEMLSPNEFVVDYNTKKMEKAYRKTHKLCLTANDIKKKQLSGEYLDDVTLGDPAQKDKEKTGESPSTADSSTPYDVLEQHTYLELIEDGLEVPCIVTVDYASKEVLKIVAGYHAKNIKVRVDDKGNEIVYDIPQDQYFVKYGFIPNPDGGFLDLGLGKLLAPTNKAVNSLMNQLMDAGTLGNTTHGFLGGRFKHKGGDLKVQMGKYTRVDMTGDDIRKNIVTMTPNQPSSVLFNLLGLLINQGQRLASTMDSQVGEDPGQNQKATTTAAVQENGQKIFNGIYKRCRRSLRTELKMIAALNAVNLPSESYLNVLDEPIPEDMAPTIAQSDYDLTSLNLVPAADPIYTSQYQRMQKSRSLMEKAQTGLVNPQEAMRRSLEAEEQSDIPALMKLPKKEPSLEERQFDFDTHRQVIQDKEEHDLNWAKHRLSILEHIQKGITVRANAMKALADAEGVEAGTQMNEYRATMQGLADEAKRNQQKMQALGEQQEQRKQQQAEQQKQQQQQQQQQMQQQGQPPQV